jgi:hypothetical protein
MRRSSPLALLLLTSALPAADEVATDYWVRVMPAAWLAASDGETSYSANGNSGSTMTLDQLDLADHEIGFGLEVSAKLPILVCVHAGGFAHGTDGSFTSPGFSYGGQTFVAGQAMDSESEISDLYLEADIRPLDLDLVGFSIGVAYHAMHTTVELSGGGTTAKLDEDLQFPVLALRGHANLPLMPSLGVEAKIHWMDLTYLDNRVSYLDATLQVTWRPWEYLGFIGGYRQVSADVRFKSPAGVDADATVDVTLGGPFLGLIAKF